MKCAFKMKLKPGCEVEYERRHRAIWPELVKLLRETGVSDYYIFWDKEIIGISMSVLMTSFAQRV